MSSSDEEINVVQSFINAKKNALNPIETDVTDLVNAGFLKKDDPAQASSMKDALMVSLQEKQRKLNEANETTKMCAAVLEAIRLSEDGTLVLDPIQTVHQKAKLIIDEHVSLQIKYIFTKLSLTLKFRKQKLSIRLSRCWKMLMVSKCRFKTK